MASQLLGVALEISRLLRNRAECIELALNLQLPETALSTIEGRSNWQYTPKDAEALLRVWVNSGTPRPEHQLFCALVNFRKDLALKFSKELTGTGESMAHGDSNWLLISFLSLFSFFPSFFSSCFFPRCVQVLVLQQH